MAISSFRFPTKIFFGPGSLDLLSAKVAELKMQRPLLVTDRTVAKLGFFEKIAQSLSSTKVFSETFGNPTESQVLQGVQSYKDGSCDGIVIIGGGCALDVGKAIALMVNHPGGLFDYEDDLPGARPMKADLIPPTIAIPTTAGTGSEVGGSSVISHDTTHRKYIIWGVCLVPKIVIADPNLTLDLPSGVTAATGVDALTHNVEAYLAKNFHPMCDGIALEGIRLISKSLVTATTQPHNVEARSDMLLASMMGATAFQKGLGATHSCAHALSTCFDLHHGLANAMMIIPCLKFNSRAVPHRFVHLAQSVGILESNEEIAIQKFLGWTDSLLATLKIPRKLSALGVRITDHLIDTAFTDVCHQSNPRICTREDFVRFYNEVF